jgi:hypothetical protein
MTGPIPPADSFAVHEPVSLSPFGFAGWQVAYADEEATSLVPVLAWGVFHLTWLSLETGEIVRDDGNVLDAVIGSTHNGQGIVAPSAAWNENFVAFLPPGVPESALTGLPSLRAPQPV